MTLANGLPDRQMDRGTSIRSSCATSGAAERQPWARQGGQERGPNRLSITFISCLYPPEREPAGIMAAQLARALKQHGHDITLVVPFPNRPKGASYPGYRRSFRRVEDLGGVRVVRCPSWFLGPKRRVWNRVLENVTFGASGAFWAAFEPRPDVVLLETWPLAAARMCMWQAHARGVPVVYYIQDLYPEVLENSGIIRKDGLCARLLRAWDRRLCLASTRVIAVSHGMRETLVRTRGLPPGRVTVIQNWIDGDEFRPLPLDEDWRRERDIPAHAFVALYAGNLGIISGADILLEAARRLQHRSDILLVCVGEGVLKDRMQMEANRQGLNNIRFEPFQDRERVPAMHAAADVCLLTIRRDPSNASMPSKLIGYMAAGRPVICAALAETDVGRCVSSAGAGLVVPPGDPDALAQGITYLQAHPREAAQMGIHARQHFDREMAFRHRYDQFVEVFFEAVSGSPHGQAEAAVLNES